MGLITIDFSLGRREYSRDFFSKKRSQGTIQKTPWQGILATLFL